MVTTIKKLRSSTKEVLNSVAQGNEVIVTNRGKAYVKIVPVKTSTTSSVKKETPKFFGMWKDREDMKDVAAYVRNLRKPRYAR
jgi:prevent-host-death family protein